MISIFGGTFDPIHNGHLYIASQVDEKYQPETVLFVPARVPPHRDDTDASPEDRAAMVQLAIEPFEHYAMSNVELDRPGISYTVDTIKTFRRTYEGHELALILGADAFSEFNEWLHYEEILEFATLIVVSRDEDTERLTKLPFYEAIQDKVDILTVTPCPVSATEIRERTQAGESIHELVPETVAAYINENKLYR